MCGEDERAWTARASWSLRSVQGGAGRCERATMAFERQRLTVDAFHREALRAIAKAVVAPAPVNMVPSASR